MPRTVTVGWVAMAALVAGGRANAQDVRWRHDYAAARKEAADSGKPLLLDFGSENCIWCQRLDGSTFRSPNVVGLLNERFIPVKFDGNRDDRITQMMGVTGFPTLVLASPDGKVLGRKNGYIDAGGMEEMLSQALTRVKSAATPPAVAVNPVPQPAPVPVVERSPAADESDNWHRELDRITARLDAMHPVLDAGLRR